MNVSRTLGCLLATALIAAPEIRVSGNEPKKHDVPGAPVTITPVKGLGSVFGEEDVQYTFRLSVKDAVKGTIVWRLAAGTATLAAREVALEAGPDAPTDVAIKIVMPAVKDGAVFHTRLTVSAFETGARKPVAVLERDVWVFPKNAFADRTEWLKKLKITLYDPKGETAKVFATAEVPFDAARDIDALSKTAEGVVVVGEGTSFKEEKELGRALQKLAAAGRPVLCLAPANGSLSVPGLGEPSPSMRALSFRRNHVRTLDKRLDPTGWPPDPKVVSSALVVKTGEDGAPVGEVVPGDAGWPWVEARFTGGGRWVVCGQAIIAKWDGAPTPRYLLLAVLSSLTAPDTDKP